MNYLKSEHLKFKRSITNKLIFIIPLMTAIFAWLVGGFISFQYLAFYWWYAFLLPGTIALFCSLSHRKEEAAGKYYSVFSLPIKLSKFELAKNGIIIEKLVCAAVFLAVLISLSRFFSPARQYIPLCRVLSEALQLLLHPYGKFRSVSILHAE